MSSSTPLTSGGGTGPSPVKQLEVIKVITVLLPYSKLEVYYYRVRLNKVTVTTI